MFENWLAECRAIISGTLGFNAEVAQQMIDGAGRETIYRKKYERGLTPQQCIDDEIYWND